MSKDEQQLFVDVDLAVKSYNEKNSKKEPISKVEFCKLWGVSYRAAGNMKQGIGLKSIINLNELIRLSGLDYSDLVKPKK